MKNIIHKPLFVLIALFVLVLPSILARAAIFEPGFEVETIATGMTLPSSMAFAPDGRIFIAEKGGAVRVIKDGALLPTPLITLTDINTFGDRGLLSIAVDPNFADNGYVYLSYTYENTPGLNFSGSKTGRVVRIMAMGDTASEGSKVVLLGTVGGDATNPSCENFATGTDCIPSDSMSHSMGGLQFGPDGFLYATFGDGSNFDAVDPRALRAQNLDSLAGKMVRINTDGTAPASNPFFDGNPNSNRSKVFAYGFRNAFRFDFHPTTGALFLGDVGWSDWEEINVVTAGTNYGWPCKEGFASTTYNCIAAGAVDPKYAYGHDSNGAGSITSGSFPTAGAYPAEYNNSFFIGDYAQNWLRRAIIDGSNNITSVVDFMDDPDGPVAISTGPDGNIYFISIYTGELHRITHTAGNRRPVPVIAANPTSGVSPLAVSFSSEGSSDPDGDAITYHWDFGDGAASTTPNPSHTYSSNGNYTAALTITDSHGSAASKSITIFAGNQKPVPQITSPASGSLYNVNQVINLNGSATDAEDGNLGAGAFQWQIILHHNTHIHIIQEFVGTTSPSFLAPDHSASDVYIEIKLTVTDSGGLTDTRSSNIYLNGGINSGNLIGNPSLEVDGGGGIPFGWVKGGYGVNNAVFTYPVAGFDGAKAAKLDVSSFSDGDAKWFFSPVFVTPGEKYDFSNYYTSNTESTHFAQFGFADGTYEYLSLGALPAATTPTKVTHQITIPSNVKTFTLFHGLKGNGSLTVDNYSLTLATSTTPTPPPPPPPPPPTGTTTLFFGGFETGNFSEWDSPVGPNFSMSGGTCRIGPDTNVNAVKIIGASTPHNQTIKKSVSTVGYSNLSVSFCYKWDALETSDGVSVEYTTDGTTWNLLKDINNSTVRHMMYAADDTEIADSNGVGEIPTPHNVTLDELASHSLALPASTANNSLFALRVREHMTDGDDFVWMDDFQIKGTVGTSTPPPPPPPPATTTNLILNPSLETAGTGGDPANWFRGGWGTNNRVFTYPVTGTAGAKAAKVEITTYTNGDAKWYFTDVPVTAGASYTLTNAYRSNAPSSVTLRYTRSDGSFQYLAIATLPASSSWTTSTQTFVIPAGVVSLTVFPALTSVGWLEIDNFSLTTTTTTGGSFNKGMVSLTFDDGWMSHYTSALPILNTAGKKGVFYVVSQYSLGALPTERILNPSLETAGTSGDPANWFRGGWGTNNRVFTYPVTGTAGAKAAKVEITTYTNGDAKWYFADTTVIPNQDYIISNSYNSTVSTEVLIRYTSTSSAVTYSFLATLPSTGGTWQNFSRTIKIPANTASLTLFHVLPRAGSLTVDNYSLKQVQVYLDPPKVVALESAGHEVGNHTRNHTSLIALTPAQVDTEIAGAKTEILGMGITNVSTMAYPFGDFNSAIQTSAQNAGMIAGRGVLRGYNTKTTDKYALKIQQLNRTTTLAEVQGWVNQAALDKTWLILMFHQIDSDAAHTFGVTPEFLEQIVNYVSAANVDVVTVKEGVAQME